MAVPENMTQKTLNTECQSVQLRSREISHEGVICVNTSQDNTSCKITGMTLLTPELLIITDFNNNAVKMVDTNSQSVSDQLQLDGIPWDITQVTNTEVAVTLPYKQAMQFISISSNKLIKKHTLKVDGECNGISCFQGKLIVSFCYPAKFQILDMNGTILKTIDGKNIFQLPWYITCNKSSIYVSDWDKKTISRLNWQGDVMDSYGDMSHPMGMSLSDDGTVFVSDHGRNVIEEKSGDCSEGQVLIHKLTKSSAVCWCGITKKLYASCDAANGRCINFLQIFNLQ
jgi:hypothetical protein